MPLLPPPQVLLPMALGAELLAAARATRPREFVAALGGRIDATAWCIETLVPLPNLAGAVDRFEVAPAVFAAAEAALRRRQLAWLGFVHSHPDGSSAPSAVDRAQLWHHCLQLIVGSGPRGREPVQCHWGDGLGFRPLPLVITAAVAS